MMMVVTNETVRKKLRQIGLPLLFTALAAIPYAVAAEEPAMPPLPGSDNEIRQFCSNIADAARDRRYLIQKQELEKLQADVNDRITVLEQKKTEYEEWLKKRNDFLKRAEVGLIDIYKNMKPDAAAPQLAELNVQIAAAIIMQLPARQSSLILSEMDAQKAAMVAAIISSAADTKTGKKKNPT
jgi:flagellar motility protein MotE (MotC chaperone)